MELWRAVPDGAHEVLPDRKCPRCHAERTHRSRVVGPLEGLMKTLTPLRPFTCSGCHWRGWRIPTASTGPAVALPPLPPSHRRSARASRRGESRAPASTLDTLRRRQSAQLGLTLLLALVAAAMMIRCPME